MLRFITAAGAAAVLLLTAAAGAHAAAYTVESCHAADGSPLATTALPLRTHHVARGGGDRCASGGGLVVQVKPGARAKRGAYVEARFNAPSDTMLSTVTLARTASVGPGYGYAAYALVGSSRRARAVEHCEGSACASLPATLTTGLPADTRALSIRVMCRARRCARPTTAAPALATITRSAVSVEDDEPPVLTAQPRGQLVEQSLQAGPRTLNVSAQDAGGGLRAIAVYADGKLLTRTAASAVPCEPPFTKPAPCPTSIDSALTLDTNLLTNGAHELRVNVLDATNTNAGTSEPFLVTIDNPGKPGSVALISATLGAGAGYSAYLRAPYGQGLTLTGRATDASGVPLAGIPLQVVTRTAGAGSTQIGAAATVTTDAGGVYSAAVPVGPSRTFTVSYKDASGRTVGAGLAYAEVRAPITLHAKKLSRNRFRLSGSVSGQPRPASGVAVEIQARAGGRWQTFRPLQTSGLGDFSTSYAFGGRGPFSLRAIVRPQNGFPFALGTSSTVKVRVR